MAGKKNKSVVARGKRKEAIARASIEKGSGIVTINGKSLEAFKALNPFAYAIASEPLKFVDAKQYNLKISSMGGGVYGQAQAIRTAIAKALVGIEKEGEALRQQMMEYDRSLLVEDPRRVEPKKFKGPGARARFTKSYR